jgi:hypothetical protein
MDATQPNWKMFHVPHAQFWLVIKIKLWSILFNSKKKEKNHFHEKVKLDIKTNI